MYRRMPNQKVTPETGRLPKWIAAAALSFSSAGALADEGTVYAGVGVGGSQMTGWCDKVVGTCDDAGRAGKLYGGYEFHRYAAVEGFVTYLGNMSGGDSPSGTPRRLEAKIGGLGIAVLGQYPLTDELSVFAKGGMAWLRTKIDTSTATRAVSGRDHSFSPLLGIGAKWNVIDRLVLRFDYERYFEVGNVSVENVTRFNPDNNNIDIVMVSVEYRY